MHELADQYTSALKNLLAGREQDSLHRAYELGQQAVENGLGVLDIAAVYREALRSLLELCKRYFAEGKSCDEVLEVLMPA